MNIGLVLLNYHDEVHIERLLKEILNANAVSKIVIVNNSQVNEQKLRLIEIIKRLNKNNIIDYIENDENLGYYKGNLVGVRTLKEKYGYEKALILNPDVGCRNWSKVIHTLYNKSQEEDMFIVGPKIIIPNHKEVSSPILEFSPLRELLNNFLFPLSYVLLKKIQTKYSKTSGYVFAVEGSAYMVDIDKFIDIQKYFDNVFLYGEEIIFGLVSKNKNWKIFFDNTAEILHYHEPRQVNKTYDRYLPMTIKEIIRMFYNNHFILKMLLISIHYKSFVKKLLL